MTNQQREAIKQLRLEGHGYKKISNLLTLPLSTVKSFCRRNDLTGEVSNETKACKDDYCRCCGEKLIHTTGAKKKIYCSDACRLKWWGENKSELKRKANYELTCKHCNKTFVSYGNKYRKYCSHACYIADRFGGDER